MLKEYVLTVKKYNRIPFCGHVHDLTEANIQVVNTRAYLVGVCMIERPFNTLSNFDSGSVTMMLSRVAQTYLLQLLRFYLCLGGH